MPPPDTNRAAVPSRSAARGCLIGIKKPWTLFGPRLVVIVSAALPPAHQLEVGTHLPFEAPLGGVPRRMGVAL